MVGRHGVKVEVRVGELGKEDWIYNQGIQTFHRHNRGSNHSSQMSHRNEITSTVHRNGVPSTFRSAKSNT